MTREEKMKEKYILMSNYENEAYANGKSVIAGIDEAGRGPLAGPVVAAACILNPNYTILGLDDSKKLSPKRRDELYDEIIKHAVSFCVIRVEPDVIDEINILNATKQAMRACVAGLAVQPELLLIDAVDLKGVDVEVIPIIKGDAKSNSIAAASILAKVTRDRIMVEYDKEYPGYGFAQHKGYGTAAHYAAIREFGFTPIHRRTFLKTIH
ncbi:MAG TPA: ribonuclease HII [Bacillota bacterium]|nr:ribonuclease HII [Bacillota bacterium]